MNRIETGKIYTAARARSGETQVGKWELLVTQDDRGNSPIAVFVTNQPSGVSEGEKFRIKRIVTVASKTRQNSNGTWVTDVSMNAEVERVETWTEYTENQGEEKLPF